jgi:hypothetical protein
MTIKLQPEKEELEVDYWEDVFKNDSKMGDLIGGFVSILVGVDLLK